MSQRGVALRRGFGLAFAHHRPPLANPARCQCEPSPSVGASSRQPRPIGCRTAMRARTRRNVKEIAGLVDTSGCRTETTARQESAAAPEGAHVGRHRNVLRQRVPLGAGHGVRVPAGNERHRRDAYDGAHRRGPHPRLLVTVSPPFVWSTAPHPPERPRILTSRRSGAQRRFPCRGGTQDGLRRGPGAHRDAGGYRRGGVMEPGGCGWRRSVSWTGSGSCRPSQ